MLILQDALSLPERPPFHNSSVTPCLMVATFILCGVLKRLTSLDPTFLSDLPWILGVSWGSHHIRDANRRGLWFAPFGSTPPLPTSLYLILNIILPLLFNMLYNTVINRSGSVGSVGSVSPVHDIYAV